MLVLSSLFFVIHIFLLRIFLFENRVLLFFLSFFFYSFTKNRQYHHITNCVLTSFSSFLFYFCLNRALKLTFT